MVRVCGSSTKFNNVTVFHETMCQNNSDHATRYVGSREPLRVNGTSKNTTRTEEGQATVQHETPLLKSLKTRDPHMSQTSHHTCKKPLHFAKRPENNNWSKSLKLLLHARRTHFVSQEASFIVCRQNNQALSTEVVGRISSNLFMRTTMHVRNRSEIRCEKKKDAVCFLFRKNVACLWHDPHVEPAELRAPWFDVTRLKHHI